MTSSNGIEPQFRKLSELNQVVAVIIEHGDGGASNGRSRHGEPDALCGQAFVVRLDAAHQEMNGGLALTVQCFLVRLRCRIGVGFSEGMDKSTPSGSSGEATVSQASSPA